LIIRAFFSNTTCFNQIKVLLYLNVSNILFQSLALIGCVSSLSNYAMSYTHYIVIKFCCKGGYCDYCKDLINKGIACLIIDMI